MSVFNAQEESPTTKRIQMIFQTQPKAAPIAVAEKQVEHSEQLPPRVKSKGLGDISVNSQLSTITSNSQIATSLQTLETSFAN